MFKIAQYKVLIFAITSDILWPKLGRMLFSKGCGFFYNISYMNLFFFDKGSQNP